MLGLKFSEMSGPDQDCLHGQPGPGGARVAWCAALAAGEQGQQAGLLGEMLVVVVVASNLIHTLSISDQILSISDTCLSISDKFLSTSDTKCVE